MHFSMRLDETDTHTTSEPTVLGGGIATLEAWTRLEHEWSTLLFNYGVDSFHHKEMAARKGCFSQWDDDRCSKFISEAAAIFDANVQFRVAVSVDSATHKAVKGQMRNVAGFSPDSDVGICIRWLLFHACLVLHTEFGNDFNLSVILEKSQYASGAKMIFEKEVRSGSKFSSHLHEFKILGKECLSLQAADAIVAIEADRISGKSGSEANRLSVRLSASVLEGWYEQMKAEKDRRRAHFRS